MSRFLQMLVPDRTEIFDGYEEHFVFGGERVEVYPRRFSIAGVELRLKVVPAHVRKAIPLELPETIHGFELSSRILDGWECGALTSGEVSTLRNLISEITAEKKWAMVYETGAGMPNPRILRVAINGVFDVVDRCVTSPNDYDLTVIVPGED